MQVPDVVVVGAATRDLVDDDPRGWSLGGGVTYGALTLARLGVRTGVVMGVDAEAAGARELDILRDAGAQVVTVPLESGPIFTNIETLAGRIQIYGAACDPVEVTALPHEWQAARAWVFAPIASELPDAWAAVPAGDACVAFAWQGILRVLRPSERVRPKDPGPSPFLARADILAFSRHDVPSETSLREIGDWVGETCDVLLTSGLLGGMLLRFRHGRIVSARAYPAVPSEEEIDPTGAGDTMLAGFVAARLAGGTEASSLGRDLYVGAGASSLLVEGPGLDWVPTFAQLSARLRTRA